MRTTRKKFSFVVAVLPSLTSSRARTGAALVILLTLSAPLALASAPKDEAIEVPITAKGESLTMKGRICRPSGVATPRVVVINHGSPPNPLDRPKTEAASCDSEAVQWFLHHNYAVVSVLRLGYGATGGPWAEGWSRCDEADFYHAGLETAREIDAIVNYVVTLPDIDPSNVIVIGQSAGGWGTIAYDSIAHPHVSAFINMAGGRGGHYHDQPNSNCHPEKLIEAVAQYGKTADAPMLWVYTNNDSFFGPELAKTMFEHFTQEGGKAEFYAPGDFGRDGHQLFFGRDGSDHWGPIVEKYLHEVSAR